ncbi:uncharacterized protein EI97DRAFT_431027 [Westerdykella ornata]|uniref:DUF1440 domain-containing protein n=1 Tax=Westerdykella ornata TaxID=318751 RepID=A0A6A6JQ60_WESOR|nr:uncharacterized protein EI97DRAFT_431027 [Westerdykella ornata]KAF2278780.1 hypothetical protein EI97DRAFT_431027 [Westerdykella ornata]
MPLYNAPSGPIKYPDSKSLYPTLPRVSLAQALGIGVSAGILGAITMVGTSKIEQFFTHRPASYVPGRTIATHFGLSDFYSRHPDILNHVHHVGMGILGGIVRAVMSYYGVIGPVATFLHLGLRVMMDQAVEMTAGVSDWPWTWPINEQVIDLGHKGCYAVVVGYLCDRLVRGVDWFNY